MKGFSDKYLLLNDKLLDYTCFLQIISSLTPKPAHLALHHNPLTVTFAFEFRSCTNNESAQRHDGVVWRKANSDRYFTRSLDFIAPMQHRQESHRVYLQRFADSSLSSDVRRQKSESASNAELEYPQITTTSVAIRLTSTTSCQDIVQLLRQKFNLKPLPSTLNERDNIPPTSAPLVNRIQAHLENVRRSKSSVGLPEATVSEERNISKKDDHLVAVVTCSHFPCGYIRFEHENVQENVKTIKRDITSNGDLSKPQSKSNIKTNLRKPVTNAYNFQKTSSNTTAQPNTSDGNSTQNETLYNKEQYNVVRTLLPSENPLQVRDSMISYVERLQEEVESEMIRCRPNVAVDVSPKRKKAPLLRWFFIPCRPQNDSLDEGFIHDSTPIRCIEIDGYTSSMSDEEEEDDSDEKEEERHIHILDGETQANDVPYWKRSALPYHEFCNENPSREQTRLQRERHRLTILSGHEAASGSDCVSGFLLKQDKHDFNVWKKFHCVLTDTQLWCVSRVKTIGEDGQNNVKEGDFEDSSKVNDLRIGKHSIIPLTGTLLLEPSTGQEPPSTGIPFLFHLVTNDGSTYAFRAMKKGAYASWTHCISQRIVQCQERILFDRADSIIRRESSMRAKNCDDRVLKPLHDKIRNHDTRHGVWSRSVPHYLLSFGVRISDFKEICIRLSSQLTFSDDKYSILQHEYKALVSVWGSASMILSDLRELCSRLLSDEMAKYYLIEQRDSILRHQQDIQEKIESFRQKKLKYEGGAINIPPIDLFDDLLHSIALLKHTDV